VKKIVCTLEAARTSEEVFKVEVDYEKGNVSFMVILISPKRSFVGMGKAQNCFECRAKAAKSD
jgi:hypothetical protein